MILRNSPLNFETFVYLERYVDIGSASGFTDIYTTSPDTRPKSSVKNFFVCAPKFSDPVTMQDFGTEPAFFHKWQTLVHPDMIGDDFFSGCSEIDHEAVLVSPTASARTVRMEGSDGWFMKLHYKGLIGRFDRRIGISNAQSAIEVSDAISAAIDIGILPKSFYLWRETFARVIRRPEVPEDWGIVLREPIPYPQNADIALLVPGFSLFSQDINHPNDPLILTQLISNQSKTIEDFMFEDLLVPVFDAYFTLLLRCGLELEAQAQNILFAIDRDMQVIGVIARDMESVDKDISLMKDLNIPNSFQITPWKCLIRGQYNYHIMHSFMFDFKLGEYLVKPIIAEASRSFHLDEQKLAERIREHNQDYVQQLPSDFFPSDGKWYSYANIVHDRTRERPYIANPNPRYR